MVNPIPVTRKVRRAEPLPECFGTLSARSGATVAKAEPYEAVPRKTVRAAAARNEFESAEIIIKSIEGDLSRVRVRLSPMKLAGESAVLPPSAVTLFRVGYVQTYNLWNKKQDLGWWPDPLFPLHSDETFPVRQGWNQAILVRFHPPPDARAGEYRGRLTVEAEGFRTESLPVRLTVFDFTLPREQHFTAAVPIWGGQMEKMYPGSMGPHRRRAYLDFLLAHRISPFPLKTDEIEYAIRHGMREFCVLTLPKDHTPGNLAQRVEKISRRWREHEFFGRAVPYVLLGDEPSVPQWRFIREQGRIIHRIEPRLLRMNTLSLDALFAGANRPKDPRDAYIKSYEALHDAVDYFLLAGGCYPVGEGTELAYARGLKVWWYTVADIVYIPTAGGHVRVHFWKQWKYHVPGWLHWGMTYWGGANLHGRNGRKWPAVPWDTRASRSGDGYLAYPVAKGLGFLPSLRLELIRDGIEDYEYFVLLKDLTDRLRNTQRAEFAARIGQNAGLLAIDDGIVHSYRTATEDGAMLLAARTRVARAIEASRNLLRR